MMHIKNKTNTASTFLPFSFHWELFAAGLLYIHTAGDRYTEGGSELVRNRNKAKHSTAYKCVCTRFLLCIYFVIHCTEGEGVVHRE